MVMNICFVVFVTFLNISIFLLIRKGRSLRVGAGLSLAREMALREP
jgi:hypothetical protein